MKSENKSRIRLNWKFLEEKLYVDPVVEMLYQGGSLVMNDRERIMAERARPDKVLKFLEILMTKDDAGYAALLVALCHKDVRQQFIQQRLQDTAVPEESMQGDLEKQHLLEQTIRDSLEVRMGAECPVEDIIKVMKIQLRRQQKCVDARDLEIYHLVTAIFPAMSLRKNKKKRVIAIKNCLVKAELLRVVENYNDEDDDDDYVSVGVPTPIPLDRVPPQQVAEVMRTQLEKEGQDVGLAARMEEEEIDGKALAQLTEGHIEKLMPDLKMGKRIRLMDAVKGAVAELQKPPEISVKGTRKPKPRRKLETFRAFDTRPKATDVYEKGYILPEEQSRPGYLLEPLHKYCVMGSAQKPSSLSEVATKVVQFAAACMNDRVNGTIHFGVLGKSDAKRVSQAGEVVGFCVNKQKCEFAITDEIYRAFYADQRERALKCIRDPVFVPVVGGGGGGEEPGLGGSNPTETFVVEVDVIPYSDVIGNEAFFLNPTDATRAELLRYIDGAPREVSGKELVEFMGFKEELTSLRRNTEKDVRAQVKPVHDLHRKLHTLLTDGLDYDVADIFPLMFLSSSPQTLTQDYLADNFCCLKSLQPLSVFDFGSPTSGIYSVVESRLDQVYEVLTTDNFDKETEECESGKKDKMLESIVNCSFRPWIFCNGYEPLGKDPLKPTDWRSQRGQGFKEAIRFYREQIPSDRARILIFLLSRNYDVLLGALEEIFVKFPDQWILLAETEKVAKDIKAEVVRRMYVEKEVLEERCVIGMPWSHVNRSIIDIFGENSGTGCMLPSSTGSPCLLKERERNSLPDLDILSMNECFDEDIVKRDDTTEIEKMKRKTEEDFYRGKEVSWWNFFFRDHVLRRLQFEHFLNSVKQKLNESIHDDEKVAIITVLHQPGSGGSTSARHVLWELKKEFRCCVIKQLPDPRQTCEQITTFRNFEEPENPKPPLVLIDNKDEEKVFQLCSYMNEKARREARDSTSKHRIFCVLVICVRMTVLPKKRDESKVGLMLGHELSPDEVQWFRSKYEILEERFKKKQLGLHPKLLISFNILKENFSPDCISRTVDEFVCEIKDYNEKRLLKYIALVNSFDPDFQSIPMSCFNMIMSEGREVKKRRKPKLEQCRQRTGTDQWAASLSDTLNILLNRIPKHCLGGGIKAVRIINNNLSREILDNLCRREKQTVSDVILEFLHSDVFKPSNSSSVQSQLVRIMKDILKKRPPYKKGREKFSPIILEIGRLEDYDKAAEVLEVGFNKFDDPMIAQQIARIYIHCSNWKKADEFARIAQDMKPKNSYLCDTHGQVYKQRLVASWKECLENKDQLEGETAKEIVDNAFKAIEIFQREQMLSDEDDTFGYNNYGFFSELRVLVTLLDCCRFFKPFYDDTGELLHNFLVNDRYVPPGLCEELGQDRVRMLKKLYHEYEKPVRRLDDQQIQLKEDLCYQYSPGYTNSIKERQMFVHLRECLDSYFGEDKDAVPSGMNDEDACEYRRRRVKRKGGNSLFSIYDLRSRENAVELFWSMHTIIKQNVDSTYCNTFDLKTILSLTLALLSKNNRRCAREIPLAHVLAWTQELYEKSKEDRWPFLEAYLYLVMINWPTEWRHQQGLKLEPCSKLKCVIKEWKEAFFNNHPAQREEEGKRPDKRKSTTLFFLGKGEGFMEIVMHNELKSIDRKLHGDEIWDSSIARERLKRLKGTLLYGGKEMQVSLRSVQGSVVEQTIPTSIPIRDRTLWQKRVSFVLGFCWSGPRAYSVGPDDEVDLGSAHTPPNFGPDRRGYNPQARQRMIQEAEEQFWTHYFDNMAKLERVESNLRKCANKKQQTDLTKKKKSLEKARDGLVQQRISVLQGPD